MKVNDEKVITILCEKVHARYGMPLSSPANFSALADAIFEATGQCISVSTLKRLWGYVATESAPRTSTLDILCRYIGYPHWAQFQQAAIAGMLPDSDFHSSQIVKSTDMAEGDELVIEWLPDRCCHLRCTGLMRYQVIAVRNAKLCVGDTFTAVVFAKGQPMEAINIIHKGAEVESYVAGRTGGLTKVERIIPGESKCQK